MEDLNEKLSRLLSDPEGMAKIQAAMAALGGGGEPPLPAPPPPSPSTNAVPDLAVLGKLMPLLSGLNGDSEDTRLLQALRPYLRGDRAGRLDDTMRLLKLAKLLPLLQEQGILSGLGGGGGGG